MPLATGRASAARQDGSGMMGDRLFDSWRSSGRNTSLAVRYGQWAVVAGASEGLGAAFAEQLAARGADLSREVGGQGANWPADLGSDRSPGLLDGFDP